jgi:hypothetical protein
MWMTAVWPAKMTAMMQAPSTASATGAGDERDPALDVKDSVRAHRTMSITR